MRCTLAIAVGLVAACGPGQPTSAVDPVAPRSAGPAADAAAPMPPSDAAAPPPPPPDAFAVPADFEITLARTACFGPCPVFTATVNAAGEVRYVGQSPVRGCVRATVPVADVVALAARVEAMAYFALADEYTTSVTDYPWANTAVTSAGRTKRVRHYLADPLGAPDAVEREALRELESAIARVVGAPRRDLGACPADAAGPGAP